MIDGFVHRINEELGEKATTIATGGLSRLILNKLTSVDALETFLTLEGMLIIYERIRRKQK